MYLSASSGWEIALKHAMGRLPLPEPPERFAPHNRTRHGIEGLPIDEDSALHGLAILGPDPLVAQYPVRTLW